ncbi:MAG: recombination mediator RecR [Candidatus Azambacteria bacterium]|nr:recombination mediator RecR [Candidatus Azambacteria bacterium]
MYPKTIQNFIDKFSRLPGVGPRQAARLAFWLLNGPKTRREELTKALESLEKDATVCSSCFFIIDGSTELTIKNGGSKCHFCDNASRDRKTICVVEKETDLATIEKSGTYKGLYHVLGGLFSALDTAIPKNLKMPELINRIESKQAGGEKTEEVILALSPTHEGDLTAYYLEKSLKPLKVRVTRLGRGLPYGSDVEFADAETLSGAMESRKEIK